MELFKIEIRAMNGTVTMGTEVSLYTTRELAEQTLNDIKESNKLFSNIMYIGPDPITVYENKSEIPFYKDRT